LCRWVFVSRHGAIAVSVYTGAVQIKRIGSGAPPPPRARAPGPSRLTGQMTGQIMVGSSGGDKAPELIRPACPWVSRAARNRTTSRMIAGGLRAEAAARARRAAAEQASGALPSRRARGSTAAPEGPADRTASAGCDRRCHSCGRLHAAQECWSAGSAYVFRSRIRACHLFA
jgi:hypothetical protein